MIVIVNKWFLGAVSGLAITGTAVQPYRPVVVSGKSMTPTYRSGELLWTAPVDRPLRRGDVVIADGPDGPVIKRVALLPGDRRGQWLSYEGWIDMTTLTAPKNPHAREKMRTCLVPPGTVYLLGDDLDVSIDSRTFGPVRMENVHRLVIDPREPDPEAPVSKEPPRRWIADAIREGMGRWAMRLASLPPVEG